MRKEIITSGKLEPVIVISFSFCVCIFLFFIFFFHFLRLRNWRWIFEWHIYMPSLVSHSLTISLSYFHILWIHCNIHLFVYFFLSVFLPILPLDSIFDSFIKSILMFFSTSPSSFLIHSLFLCYLMLFFYLSFYYMPFFLPSLPTRTAQIFSFFFSLFSFIPSPFFFFDSVSFHSCSEISTHSYWLLYPTVFLISLVFLSLSLLFDFSLSNSGKLSLSFNHWKFI